MKQRHKYKKIIKSSVEEVGLGFSHRRHRKTEKKTGRRRNLNFKKQKINKIKEDEEWKECINLIRNEL